MTDDLPKETSWKKLKERKIRRKMVGEYKKINAYQFRTFSRLNPRSQATSVLNIG
jgi:hypothetical protein